MEGGEEINNRIVEEVFEVMEEADKECCSLVHKKNITTSSSLSVGHVFRKVFSDYLERSTCDNQEIRRIKEALFNWSLRLVLYSGHLYIIVIYQIYDGVFKETCHIE